MIAAEQVPQGYAVEESFDLHGFNGLVKLVKAEEVSKEEGEEDKFAYVAGIFSADTKDLDGEVLDQDGVAEGLSQYFEKLNSQVDWEHEYANTKDPDTLIGDCLRFEPRTLKKNGKRYRAHWGVFRLFKQKPLTKKVLRHLDAGGKIGASIHGVKLVPTKKGQVNKVMITRISLTPNPVNTETDITRYNELLKSLTAAGGAALTPEDLEGDGKKLLHDRITRLAKNFREQGLDATETRTALESYFADNLKKGEIDMDNLKTAVEALNKALDKDETAATLEPAGEGEQESLNILQKAFGRFGYTLVKAKADEEGEGKEEGEDEGEGMEYKKAVTFLKSLGREALLKMGTHAKIVAKMKGKKNHEMADYLSKHLGDAGTVALVKKYRTAKSVDEELLAADEALIKSFGIEAEDGAGAADLDATIGEEEVLGLVSDESYKALIKSITDLRGVVKADRTRLDEPVEALTKAVAHLVDRQKKSDARFESFCKAVRLPGLDRMVQAIPAERGGSAPLLKGGDPAIHDAGEVYERLEKAVVEGKLTPQQVTVAKNHARHNAALPKDVERVLYPVAA